MWFRLALTALAIVVVSGLYVRRRFADALLDLGVRERRVRVVRWAVAGLLLGYPLFMVGAILAFRWLGVRLPRFDGVVTTWLFTLPFAWLMLVVLQSAVWLLLIDVVYAVLRRRGQGRATRLRSVAVIAVVAFFGVYTPARILIERGELRVRHHEVAARAATGTTLRIAFVADVQQSPFVDGARAREVYQLVNDSRPDLVLSGGDWIDRGTDHIEEAAAAAATLKSPMGTLSVRGDHDHFVGSDRDEGVKMVERALAARGVAMINDDVRWFERGGRRVAVVFLGHNYMRRAEAATVERLIAATAGADYRILVAHQLDAGLAAQLRDRVDLILAAHTHGGQVNPVVGVVHANLARVETAFVDGRYPLGSTVVIVTAGIGYSIVPFRYAAPASFEVIDVSL